MNKMIIVLGIGFIAGVLDLIPLVMVNAPLFNMLSIVSFWLVTAYIVSISKIVQNKTINGLLISVLLMVPMALAVSATNPKDFLPMFFMAIVLGPLVGFCIGKLVK